MDVTSYLLGKKAGGGGDTPTGEIDITTNGVVNVKSYATANVNVQPILESKSITITENGTQNVTSDSGYDGLSNVSVTVNVSGGGGLDWSAIGYSEEPQSIEDDYNYSKNILDNWDATQTNLQGKFSNDINLVYMPLVDTSNATTMQSMFNSCSNLVEMPLLNTSNVTLFYQTFQNCSKLKNVPLFDTRSLTGNNAFKNTFQSCYELTDQSLDNILQMCINATSYTATNYKTLTRLGITVTEIYPVSRIEALPHYQDFINAGWTIGY